jgi:hypothetical protein
MRSVHLLATSHFHHHSQRITNAINEHDPDCISIEYCAAHLSDRVSEVRRFLSTCLKKAQYDKDKQDFGAMLIQAYLCDYLVAEQYSKKQSLPFYLSDPFLTSEERDQIMRIHYSLLLHTLVDEYSCFDAFSEMIDTTFRQREALYTKKDILRETEQLTAEKRKYLHEGKRDAVTAKILTSLLTSHNRILHICGADHAYDDTEGQTLYAQLRACGVHVTRATPISYT